MIVPFVNQSSFKFKTMSRLSNCERNYPTSSYCTRVKTDKITLLTIKNEPQHDKTNKMTCAPCEDSDQPRHPSGLIRVFVIHMKKGWVPLLPTESTAQSLIRLGGLPG